MPSSQRRGVVVALGGNALSSPAERSNGVSGQIDAAARALDALTDTICQHRSVLISHGNGPQVGNLLLRSELSAEAGLLPPLPLDTCVADTAGGMGYLLAREARNALTRVGIDRPVLATITTVLVEDLYGAPQKPIGQVFPREHRRELVARGWLLHECEGGLRRVVPSPHPLQVLETDALRVLFEQGVLLIAGGGGGVAVSSSSGVLVGVEAVVDKDLTASLIARSLRASILVILTNVEGVFEHYGTSAQALKASLTVTEARELLARGVFGEGSMLPKVAAACDFVADGGHRALICHLDDTAAAMRGMAGTTIVPDTPKT